MAKVDIVMIAAVARNGVIGIDGDMPWRIPSDFAHFKRTTMGKPIVMGRKQYETLGKPLPGRVNIIVSRQVGFQPDGVIVINDFEAAIAHAKSIALADGVSEVMIIGGGEIYKMGMAMADRLIISHVDLEADIKNSNEIVVFPKIEPTHWNIFSELSVLPNERDEASYSIKVYQRIEQVVH